MNESRDCTVLVMNVPGLSQQYKSYLQTFEQSSEVQVIPQNQKQEDVFLTCPFYKGKAIISNLDYLFPHPQNKKNRDISTTVCLEDRSKDNHSSMTQKNCYNLFQNDWKT
jgi:translation elongation factor EF-1alpha